MKKKFIFKFISICALAMALIIIGLPGKMWEKFENIVYAQDESGELIVNEDFKYVEVDYGADVELRTDLYAYSVVRDWVKVKYNEKIELRVLASNKIRNITYQWYEYDSYNGCRGDAIVGETKDTLIIYGNENTLTGYYCEITDGIETVGRSYSYS